MSNIPSPIRQFEFNAIYVIDSLAPHWNQIELGPTFIVDIYTNTPEDYSRIARVINANLPDDMKFRVMSRYWNFDFFLQEMAA